MISQYKVTILPLLLLYLSALLTILLTASVESYHNLLEMMTQENGFFETLTVLLLLIISIYGWVSIVRSRHAFNRMVQIVIIGFSLLTFLAAMEEISWGQNLFHFQSSDYFLRQNLQQETNLHNLMDANLFSSIIYSCIYMLLVFIPLLYKLFKSHLSRFSILGYFDIDPHIILVVLFASVFQIYFYYDMGVIMDMVTHLSGLLLFGLYLWLKGGDRWLKIHFLVIIMATALSMASYKIYSFFNMQYEIREMFVVLAVLFIFIELIQREKNEKSSMDNR